MPKKHPISNNRLRGIQGSVGLSPVTELQSHLDSTKASIRRLGYALGRYYKKGDPQRRTFLAIETLFIDYVSTLRAELAPPGRGKHHEPKVLK